MTAALFAVQQTAGNHAVQRWLARQETPSTGVGEQELKTQHYELSEKLVALVKEDPTAGKAAITASPAEYCADILRNAGLDPDDWYSNFTKITFLGKEVGDPIHLELATHLRNVEHKFAEKYGGPDKKPEVAGKALGLTETIAGARTHPTSAAVSMHLFGLAIDVNYTANPFISSSANSVFERAGLLLGKGRTGFKPGMKYDDLSRLDELLEDYFALLKATDRLEAALEGNGNAPWKSLSAVQARTQIQRDLDFVTTRWEREKPAQKAVIEAGGFMDLDKRLVEEIGLDWGASYGDMMHFDMRNTGNGAKIQKEVRSYMTEKQKESKAKWAEAHARG
jgi:hypothetical protein